MDAEKEDHIVARSPAEINHAREMIETSRKKARPSTGHEGVDDVIIALQRLGNTLSCPVCKSLLKLPAITSCKHVICAECALLVFPKDTPGFCPECRKQDLHKPKQNLQIQALVNLYSEFHPKESNISQLTQVGTFSQLMKDLYEHPVAADAVNSSLPSQKENDASMGKDVMEIAQRNALTPLHKGGLPSRQVCLSLLTTAVGHGQEIADTGSDGRTTPAAAPRFQIGPVVLPSFDTGGSGSKSHYAEDDSVSKSAKQVLLAKLKNFSLSIEWEPRSLLGNQLAPADTATPIKFAATGGTTQSTVKLAAFSASTPMNQTVSNKTPPTLQLFDGCPPSSSSSSMPSGLQTSTKRKISAVSPVRLEEQINDESPPHAKARGDAAGTALPALPPPPVSSAAVIPPPEILTTNPPSAAPNSADAGPAPPQRQQKDPFRVGAVVTVSRRMGPGENKPGGVAKITKHNPDGTFDVRYTVEGTSEKRVPKQCITPGMNVDADSLFGKPAHAEPAVATNVEEAAPPRRPVPPPPAVQEQTKLTSKKKQKRAPLKEVTNEHEDEEQQEEPYSLSKKNVVVLVTGQFDERMRGAIKASVSQLGGRLLEPPRPKRRASELEGDGIDWGEVSHVITSTIQGDDSVASFRSSKYLTAICHGVWVVNSDWITKSNSACRWLKEEPFEVSTDSAAVARELVKCDGPKRAREILVRFKKSGDTSLLLFSSYEFAFVGDFSNGPDPVLLASKCGAKIFQNSIISMASFQVIDFVGVAMTLSDGMTRNRCIIFSSKEDGKRPEKKQKRWKQLLEDAKSASLCAMDFCWMLDCLSAYSLLPTDVYAAE